LAKAALFYLILRHPLFSKPNKKLKKYNFLLKFLETLPTGFLSGNYLPVLQKSGKYMPF